MPDERFIMHRLKSTRFAMVVGIVLIFAFFTHGYLKGGIIRWDHFSVLLGIALAKVGAMIYYRRTN